MVGAPNSVDWLRLADQRGPPFSCLLLWTRLHSSGQEWLSIVREEKCACTSWNAWTEELVPKNAKTAIMQLVMYTHSTMLNAACGARHWPRLRSTHTVPGGVPQGRGTEATQMTRDASNSADWSRLADKGRSSSVCHSEPVYTVWGKDCTRESYFTSCLS